MKSISRQILLYLLCSLGGLLAIIGGLLYLSIDRTMYVEFDHDLRRQAELLAAQVNTDEHGKIRLDLTLVPGRFSGRMLLVLDPHGATIYRSAEAPTAATVVNGFGEIELHGEAYRTYTLTSMAQPDEDEELKTRWPPTPFALVYGRSLEGTRRVDRIVTLAIAGAAALGAGLAAVVIVWAVKKGLAPLGDLSDRLQQMDVGSLKEPITLPQTPTELNLVVERLNDLMRRLDEAFDRQTRFTSNAAHEFRTPIAEIRSVAEVALMRPALDESEKLSFRDILASASRMQELAATLLSLARGGDSGSTVQLIDLRNAIDGVIHRLKPADSAVQIHDNAPASATVIATSEALDGILINVLQNALEYRCGDEPVDITMQQHDGGIRIEIANTVAAEDLQHIDRFGEQFWRRSDSRTEANHSGLGCALVKMYVAMIGGQVVWKACAANTPRIVCSLELRTVQAQKLR